MNPLILQGSFIRLEPLSRSHLAALWPVAQEQQLWKWTTASVQTPADLERYVEEALREQESASALPFATAIEATGEIIGSTRFGNFSAPHRRVEIGWTWVAPRWQRTRVNSEAKYLMLRHAFEDLGLVRVELKTDALNAQSRAAILRLGAKEEGIFRRHMITDHGRMRDTAYYSILADEWPAVKRNLEEWLRRDR